MLIIVPKCVDPVTKSTEDVIVCTIRVCAVIVPVEVNDPLCNIEPVIVWVPINVFEPVVAKLLVLAFKDDVYESIEALKAFIEALTAYKDAVAEFNEEVAL